MQYDILKKMEEIGGASVEEAIPDSRRDIYTLAKGIKKRWLTNPDMDSNCVYEWATPYEWLKRSYKYELGYMYEVDALVNLLLKEEADCQK